MFERLKRVISEKNKTSKEIKRRRKRDIEDMRNESIFSAKLSSDLSIISVLLMDDSISKVEVEVEPENVARLDSAMYGYEMAEYQVVKDDMRYTISNKEISF